MSCIGITKGADFLCATPLQAGVDPDITIINFDDIDFDSITYSGNTILTLPLIAGKKGFAFQGTRNSVVPNYTNTLSTFALGFDHTVQYQVFDVSQSQKDNLEALASKGHVIIVKNKSRLENQSPFEVYGLNVGLELPDAGVTRLPGDQATVGSFTCISKTSDDGAKENKMPRSFWNTDYATTLALVQDISNIPSIDNVTPIAVATAGGTSLTITGDNFFLNAVDDVTQLDWVDSVDAVTNQAAYTTNSNTQISIATSVALSAGTYKLRVTTTSGIAESELIIVAS